MAGLSPWGAEMARALASHQCNPGSIPGLGVICGLSLLLVLVLSPRGFSPGTPIFPSPQNPTFPNSNSIWIIVKHFIISLWLGRLHKQLPVLLTLHNLLYFTLPLYPLFPSSLSPVYSWVKRKYGAESLI